MANERLIEVISPQSYEAIEKLKNQLLEAASAALELKKAGNGINLKPSQIQKSYTETATAIKSTQKAVTDYEKQLKILANAEKRQMQASNEINKAIQKRRFETRELNKQAKDQAVLSSKLASEYQKQEIKLKQLRKAYKDLAVRQELHGNLTKKEVAEMKKLELQANKIDGALKKVDKSVGQSQRFVGEYERGLSSLKGTFKSLISAFGITSGIMIFAQLMKGAANTIKEFDSGLKNVQKTTGLTSPEIKNLGDEILALSKKLQTVGTKSLLEYATVAGQLGVKGSKNILAFTESLAKLETASDITGEAGGASIARLLTLVDGGVQNIEDFGDEIVRLGNNFAATESEILGNATAIAQNTGIYKLGRQAVLAYATATKAVGIESEITGSTIGKTLGIIEKSLRTGKGLDAIVALTGKNVNELKELFKQDAGAVFTELLKGLNDVDKAGGSVNEQLEELGIIAVRDQRVIGSLATAGFGTLERSMIDVTNASGALGDEFALASTKLEQQTKRLGNAWDNFILSIEKGEGVLGRITLTTLDVLSGVLDGLAISADKNVSSWKLWFAAMTNNQSVVLQQIQNSLDLNKASRELTKSITEQNQAYIDQYGSLGPLTEEQSKYIENQEKINILSGGRSFEDSTDAMGKQSKTIKQLQEDLLTLNTELLNLDATDKKGIANKKSEIRLLQQRLDAILGTTKATKESTKAREKEVVVLQQFVDLLYKLQANRARVDDKMKTDAAEALKNTTVNTDALEKQNEVLQKQQAILNKKSSDEKYEAEMIKNAFISLGAELGIQANTISNLFDDIRSGFKDTESSIQSFTALFQDALGALSAGQARRTQERLDMLKKEHDISIAFAGDSAEAKGAIEERYQRQVAQAKEKQARNEKRNAIISAIINTAAAVVKTLAQLGFPAGIPASLIVGALGAAQTAIIASQPIPQFKEGVRDFEGGQAIVGDGGKREPITDKKGKLIGVSPNRPTLVNLPKGANVFKNEDTFNKELNSILGKNAINPIGNALTAPTIIMGATSNGMDEAAMRRALQATLGMMPINSTIIDKDGIKTFSQKQYSKGQSLNNRVTRKGISV